jgi:hypothetical protein
MNIVIMPFSVSRPQLSNNSADDDDWLPPPPTPGTLQATSVDDPFERPQQRSSFHPQQVPLTAGGEYGGGVPLSPERESMVTYSSPLKTHQQSSYSVGTRQQEPNEYGHGVLTPISCVKSYPS